MRLIGGNISDTPVKEIADGSAFSVGGTVPAPTLSTFGTGSALGSAISGLTEPYNMLPRAWASVKWADNSFGLFWVDKTGPNEVWYIHIQTNANGTFASAGTAVDVSAIAFSEPDGGSRASGGIEVKKLSASRVTIQLALPSSTCKVQWATFDKNTDTLTQHGSTITYNTAYNHLRTFSGFGMAVVNSTTVLGIFMDKDPYGSTMTQRLHPVTAAGTLAKGTSVDTGTVSTISPWTEISNSIGWTDSSGVTWFAGLGQNASYNVIKATVTPGSTPSVAVNSTITGLTGFQLSSKTATGDLAGGVAGTQSRYHISKDDVEVGRCIWLTGNVAKKLTIFGGGTNPSTITREIYKFNDEIASLDHIYTLLEVSYDEDTYWGKYILCNADANAASYTAYIPFAFNWSTFELVQPITGTDDATNTNVTPTSANRIVADYLGSSTATNLLNISDESADGVPSTMPVVL